MFELNLDNNKLVNGIKSKMGDIICALIILANVLYRMLVVTDFSITALTNITAEVIIYIISIWIIYILSQRNGCRDGKHTDIYVSTMKAYFSVREKTYCMMDKLSTWCRGYVLNDLKKRKTEVLVPNDVPYEDYTGKYKGKSSRVLRRLGLIRLQIKAVKEADRIKPYRLTASRLLTSHEVDTKNNHARHPSEVAAKDTVYHLVRYAVMGMFIVNITYSASTSTDTQSAIIDMLIRVISLVLALYAGYKSGYYNQSVVAVNYTAEQTEMLTMFSLGIGNEQ